jgi:hypothetical protein
MSDTYDEALQEMILNAGARLNLSNIIRRDGTYCFLSGPTYETRAECRFLRSIGIDCVGMSTVPEIIAAKHCGMKIIGLSLVTNKVIVNKSENAVHASHAEVLEAVNASGKHVEALIKDIAKADILGAYLDNLPPVRYQPTKPAEKIPIKIPKAVSSSSTTSSNDFGSTLVTLIGISAVVVGTWFVVNKYRK